jgi:hypothetical protein
VALPVLVRLIGKKIRFTTDKKVLIQTQAASIDTFMFIFLLLLALRGVEVGNDTGRYQQLYNRYSAQRFSELLSAGGFEVGYKLLNWLVGNTAGHYQVLLAVTAVICVYPLWYFYKRETENQLLTIALFLTVAPYTMYLTGIRQAIAMSMGVPAWYAAKNKKLTLFVAIVVLAMQFHTSAFLLCLIYPLYHMRITKKWLWFIVPCMVAMFAFRKKIFTFLFVFLWKEYTGAQETGATTILILLLLFGLYTYILPEEKDLDKDAIAMRNMLLLSIVIQFFAMLHPLSMRMNYYFLIFIPILIPRIASRSKKQFAQLAKLSVVVMTVFFLSYFLNSVIMDYDVLDIFPYIPFWK